MPITHTRSGHVGTIVLTFTNGKRKEITPRLLGTDPAAVAQLLRVYVRDSESLKTSKLPLSSVKDTEYTD